MNNDDILLILILVVLVLFVYRGCVMSRFGVDPSGKSDDARDATDAEDATDTEDAEGYGDYEYMDNVEHMAPLDFGTFKDNYPRGECRTGEYWKRKPCEVGNCNLGTTVSDQQFCRIQCAQDPDPLERQDCYDNCIANLC